MYTYLGIWDKQNDGFLIKYEYCAVVTVILNEDYGFFWEIIFSCGTWWEMFRRGDIAIFMWRPIQEKKICMCVCICVYMYIYVYVYIYTHTDIPLKYVYL